MSAFLTLASFWLPHHPTSCYYSKGFDSAIFTDTFPLTLRQLSAQIPLRVYART
jgi:hypothetical protein